MKPLCVDLFCGLGGWAEGFLSEGYDVIGFDIERRPYPGQLVLQDVTTLHGSQFRDATVIVASPPCQKYSYMAMPWSRSKEMIRWYEAEVTRQLELNCLFNTAFAIAAAAGKPLVVENVKGAQRWVGSAEWHSGAFYLWGDVPGLMPTGRFQKGEGSGRSWFYKNGGNGRSASSHSAERRQWTANAAKIPFLLAQHIARVFKP